MDEIHATSHETDIPFTDLPTWMRQSRQGIDWGILIAIFFSLLMAWSFLLQPGLPRTNATENHVFMAADYATSIREGRLYPRWSAAALDGYGAPIPHYTPPGTAYTVAIVEVLFTNDTVIAVRLVYVLALVFSGSMTYVFVMRWGGARAGVLASVLYVYSPYIGLTAPQVLGDLPGVISFALLPALLWSNHRLLFSNRPFDFILVALSLCALVLTAPKTALVGGMLSGALLVWYQLTQLHKKRVFWAFLAMMMGIMLASFYWLPALLEHGAVQWQPHPIVGNPQRLTFPSILMPLQRIDLSELVITPQFTIGIGLLVFILLGLMIVLQQRGRMTLFGVFLGFGIGILVTAIWIFPEDVWLLGPAIWCLAVGGSSATQLTERVPPQWGRLVLPAMMIFVLLLAAPVWLSPRWSEIFGGVSLNDQVLYEQQGFGIAVLPPGSDVPVTLSDAVLPDRNLLDGYQRAEVVRVVQNRLSSDEVQVTLIDDGTHQDSYWMTTILPLSFDVLRASFPGWRASLNGESVDLRQDKATGLMAVSIPPVRTGQLTIFLGTTRVRQVAWGMSWLAVVGLLLAGLRRFRNQPDRIFKDAIHDLLKVQEARLVAIVAVSLLISILLFVTEKSPYTLHARPGHGLDGTTELHSRTNAGLEALSYQFQLKKVNYHIGESVEFFIAWRTSRPLLRNYSVRVYLLDTVRSVRWLYSEPSFPGGYPTSRWYTNTYIRDEHRISLSSTLPAGDYRVAVEVFHCNPWCSDDNRLTFFNTQGQSMGQALVLPPTITIEP